MPKYSNTIEYNITTKLDAKGLTQLQNQIREVEASLNRMGSKKGLDEAFNFSESAKQLQELNRALSTSFNSSLGMLDISKFKTELKDAGVTAQSLGKAFSEGGTQGKIAFNNLLGQLGKVDTGLKRSSATVDKMFNTISNTVRWGIVSSGFSAMLNSLHQSVDYVKELDNSMTQIMLVTDYSRQQMNEYAKSANEAAKALGNTTVGVMQGTQIFAQQGYNLEQSGQLAGLSIKLANASEQDAATTSDQITALMNAYNLDGNIENLSQALDSWALVANVSAADVEELAKASQKAASSASTVGVDLDQMNAQIATIESVTRDAPEQIGNGLKTLYARLSDIGLGETLEDGVNLGKVTGVLDRIGVEVLDQAGQMRNVGDIMEDLMVVWDSLDQTSKEAAGQAIAGKYQLNRFYALMDNSDMYREYKASSENADGTLDQMNEEYMNSLEGKTKKFQATLEGLFNSVFNPDNFYPAIDALTGFVDTVKKLVDTVGGGKTILAGIAALFTRIFSNNIAQAVNDATANREMDKLRKQNAIASTSLINELMDANPNLVDENTARNMKFSNFLKGNQDKLSESQLIQGNQIFEDSINATNRWNQALGEVEKTATQIQFLLQGFKDPMRIFTDENGLQNITPILEEVQNLPQKINLKNLKQEVGTALEGLEKSFLGVEKGAIQGNLAKIEDSSLEAALSFQRLSGALSTDEFNRFQDVLELIKGDLDETTVETDDFQNAMLDAALSVEKLQAALANLDEESKDKLLEKFNKQFSNALMVKGEQEGTRKLQEGFQSNSEKQFNVQNIINTASAVGQLTFAVQSFLNLGSIWQNQDLSDGEKVLQTVMNLSMVIPSVVDSIRNLKKMGTLSSLKDFFMGGGIKTAKEQLSEVQELKNKADQAVASAKKRYDTNAQKYAEGLSKDMRKPNEALVNKALGEQAEVYKKVEDASKGLTAAQINLAAGIAAVIAAIVITVIDAYGNSLEESRKKSRELADESIQVAEETKKNVENWQSLYDKYKETGTVSEDLIKTSKELSKSLGVVGGDALIAANNFDTLQKSIEKAAGQKYEKAVEDSMGAIGAEQAVYDNNPFSTLPFIGSESVMSELKDTAGKVRGILRPEEFKLGFNPGDGGSPIDMINGMTASLERLKDARDKLNTSTAEGQQIYQRYTKAINETEKGLREENVAEVLKEAEAAFNNQIQIPKFQKELEKLGTDTDAIMQKFNENEATSGWFNHAQSESEKLSLLMNSVTDESQKAALSVRQIQTSLQEEGKNINFSDYIKFFNDLSSKEQLKLVGNLDTDKTEEQIKQELQHISENIGTFLLTPEIDNSELNKAADTKAGLEKLYDAYDKAGGAISEDDAAAILKENPEYIEFLDRVGEAYVLNRRFLDEYNESVREQKRAMDELQGDSIDLREQNDIINQLFSSGEDNEKYGEIYKTLSQANTGMINGDLSNEDFLNSINEGLDKLSDKLKSIAGDFDQTGESAKDFLSKLNDSDFNAINTVFDELFKGLQQSSKQFKSGQKTIGQYAENLKESTESAKDFAEAIGDTDSVNKINEVLNDGIDGAIEFSNYLTDNYDAFTEIFDDSFNVLESASDGLGGIDEQYQSTIEGMVESSRSYYAANAEEANAMSEQLAAIFAQNAETAMWDANAINEALISGNENFTSALMGNAEAASAFAAGTANSTQTAISQMATGITTIIQGTLALISSISGDVQGDVQWQENSREYEYVDDQGKKASGTVHVPGFRVNIKGGASGGGGGAGSPNTVSSTGFNKDTGKYETKTAQLDKYGNVHHSTTKNATYQEIMSSGAYTKTLESGLSALVGGKASLSNYAPTTRMSPSNAAPVRTPSKGGGGGGGSCFIAGTLITMQGYYQEIEKVNKGDIVLSYNETTKTNEYSQVIQTMIHATTEKIYTLYIKDEQLRVTGIHRFFIKRNNRVVWIEAENLRKGDLVFFANGTWHKILKISVDVETRYVYNFEVSNNHNYYVGINRILVHNKGGGGGGGGGSGKTYEPKQKDPIEEEIDLYEKVNTQLDDVEETLKGIEQETDRLIGARGRANMNKQITLLQKEIKLQKEKLAIQEKERNDLRNQLTQRFGVTYDSEGFIDNYAATLKKLEGEYNNLINQYNATTTEAGQEALEEQIEKAKENIDDFKDLYKRFDELQGKEIKDTLNQLEELEDKIEDLRIEAYKASQEAIDDLKELRDNAAELLGLFTDYESDSPFRATIVDAEKLKNIFGGTKKEAAAYYDTLIRKNQELARTATDEATRNAALSSVDFFQEQKQSAMNNPLGSGALGLASADLARLQEWVNNPSVESNPFGKDTAALYEAYEDAYNRMRELAMESEEAWEQLRDDIIDGYDDMAEREEEQIERYDRLTDKLETIADTHALVYGEDAYEEISKIYQQIGNTTLQQARDQKMIYESWVQRYQAIEDKTSDIAKEVRKHMEEAEDKLAEMQKSVVEAWQEAFENALKEITAKTNKNLFGQRNLDDVESDWERDRDYAERYYDDIQKAARVDQLRAKYLDLLDDAQTSSLATQNKIRDAMNEQVAYLQNQKNLSEYNVKYANAQLEILQKQLALEDARNNKNQMRLRRDTQGNYRYVYTANQNDIRDKEQDLLQSQMDAYDMSKQNRMDMTQEAFNLYRTTMEQLEALNQRIREGDEEAVKAKEQLLEDFERDMKAYSEEIGESWNGMVESIEWMAETGTDAVKDSVQTALEAIRTNNDDVLEDMGVKGNEFIGKVFSDIENVVGQVTDASNQMTGQAEAYRTLIEQEVAPIVKNGFDNIDAAIKAAEQSTKDLATATNELNTALMGDNAQLVEATKKLEDYRKQLEGVKEASAVTAQQLRNTQAALDQAKSENLNYRTILEDIAAGRRDRYGNVPMQASGGGNGDLKGYNLGTLVEGIAGDIWVNGEWGNDPTRHALLRQKFGSRGDEMYNHVQWRFNTGYGYNYPPEHGFDRAYYHQFDPDKFDTGGYTGTWGGNGKLAMLHEKELVLNSSDTENILSAVDMVRQMADTLKTLSGLSVKGTGFNKLGGDTIKQRVEITAEFPNVQSSNEIENALLSLADSAYQYSYRTI